MGIHFANANTFLLEMRFNNCQLDYTSFYKLKLPKLNFTDCSLRDSDFVEADIVGADFSGCDMYGTSFERTNLSKADFRTASNYNLDPSLNKMTGAKFTAYGLAGLVSKHKLDISV